MRLKNHHLWGVAAVSALVLAGCAPAGTAGEHDATAGESRVLTITTGSSDGNYDGVAMKAFMDRVTEETDGRITFDPYFSGSLVPYAEMFTATSSGLVDIASPGFLVGIQETPALGWVTSAGQTETPTSFPHSVLATTVAAQEYFTSQPSIDEYAKSGLVPIALAPVTLASIFCTEDFGGLAGVQGRLVRAAGGEFTEEAQALGMSPVALAPADIYEGLQRGVIDCAMFDSAAMNSYVGFDPVTLQYLLPLSNGYSTLIMNEESFDSLSSADQQVVLDAGAVFAGESAKAYISQLSAAYSEGAENLTLRIDSEMVDILRDLRADRQAKLSASPPPSSTIEDADEVLERYWATMAEWTDLLTDDLDYPLAAEDASSHQLKSNLISGGGDPRVDTFLERFYESYESSN